jgi:hypothetical protein
MFATLLSGKHNQESFHGCEVTFKGSITCIASSTRRRDSLPKTLAGKVHPHPPFLINLSPFDLTLMQGMHHHFACPLCKLQS